MKILIVSDSHGLTEELSEIKARHSVDIRIHCGDSELDMDAASLEGFYKVAGNCDFDNRLPDEEVIDFKGIRFLIVHGHLHRVNQGLMNLSLRAKEVEADVVCFGHTHAAGAIKVGEQLFINPGSIKQPRGEVKERTYAILEVGENNEFNVEFYTMEGNRYDPLNYSS